MEKEELNKLIDKIESENPVEKAFFGLHSSDYGESSYIKANKYGLELFARELLIASSKSEENLNEYKDNVIEFSLNEKWLTSDIWINHIELKKEDRIDLIKEEIPKITWKDKFILVGCFFTIALLIIIFIVGLFSVFNWYNEDKETKQNKNLELKKFVDEISVINLYKI
ncbi:hypothetical protein [Flavobacterium terrigena]|uniref:Uncharacterized protein n=1 Tax=Flavobacterium terrigena TaxID=402734 RepID=A0A1H6TPR6_9FLAO|nr:hypothetical protein [Flavobacterium terrigena]SEI77722.1 hypothetical protein SAMN05660918_1590 [Flavobacterium terrigena]